MINEIAFACYAINDVKRARKFYEKILGLKPSDIWEGNGNAFIEYKIGPHTLAIGSSPKYKPGKTGATVALETDNFDALVKRLKKYKVKFLMDCHDTSVCRMALVADPEGNQVMIHQRKAVKK